MLEDKEKEKKQEDEEPVDKVDDELLDFIKQLEETTGEQIELKDINIKKAPQSFFWSWFFKSLIEAILIYAALFGFVSLFNVFSYENMGFLFIYLGIPSILHFISCLIMYLFRKKIVFIFNNIILSALLMIYIIVPAFVLPYIYLNNLYSIFLVSFIVGISKTLILRTIRKLR